MGTDFAFLEPRNTGVALGYNASLAAITALFCLGQNRDFVHNIKKRKTGGVFLWFPCFYGFAAVF